MKLSITKIHVFQYAKLSAIFGVIMGLLVGLIYAIALVAISALSGEGYSVVAAIPNLGVIGIISMPIFYAAIGFISGIIFGLFYNLIVNYFGGIEIDIEQTE